jgi:hypothetical protein
MKMSLIAKPIIKNKFWIVEDDGVKIATIQKSVDGVVLVKDRNRQQFPSIRNLEKTFNINFVKNKKVAKNALGEQHEINGYPTNSQPYNILHNVKDKTFIYTKQPKSKSYFCAGYYIVKFSNSWVRSFCPKIITLERYKFRGPFKSKTEMNTILQNIANEPNNQTI